MRSAPRRSPKTRLKPMEGPCVCLRTHAAARHNDRSAGGACAYCRTTSDRHLPPESRASVSRVGDDLASVMARIRLDHYVKHHELTLIEVSASGLGPKHNERNYR
jgi:hypothetical protein